MIDSYGHFFACKPLFQVVVLVLDVALVLPHVAAAAVKILVARMHAGDDY